MHFSIINDQGADLDAVLQEMEDRVDHNQFYQFENSLTQDEINKIIKENELSTHRATTFSGSSDSIRKRDINWIEKEKNGIDNTWLFQRIANMTVEANTRLFNFNLFGMFEGLQYTVYNGNEDGFYCKHVDHGKNFYKRKISVVIQLSDPDSYEGGDLLTHTADSATVMPRGLGTTILFPSWMLHEVTPVTKGIRRSLDCWVSGPPFQ